MTKPHLVARSRDMTGRLMARRTAPITQMVLDGRWKAFQDEVFFTKLLEILRRETKVEDSWRRELRRAAVMIGESVGANDRFKSFLWNMIALEMLLTREKRGLLETLPKRAEALLGWVSYWEAENYDERISDLYRKRNSLLHQGQRDAITAQDLAFTDHLLLNLLTNLVSLPKLFRSKADVIQFSERVEAERTLGVRPRVRPKDLKFFRRVRPDF